MLTKIDDMRDFWDDMMMELAHTNSTWRITEYIREKLESPIYEASINGELILIKRSVHGYR